MAKSIKKIIVIGLVMIMSLAFLSACDTVKYHAKVYYWVDDYVKDEFFENEVEYPYGWIGEDSQPNPTSFIINDAKRLEEIFVKFPYEVNFEIQMVLMHVYTTGLITRQRKIKAITQVDDYVTIKFNIPKFDGKDAYSKPRQRTLIVIMDKLNISNVIFENA